MQWEARHDIARALRETFPDQLDVVTAAAVAGAFTGAVGGAVTALLDQGRAPPDPDAHRALIRRATEVALADWRG